MTLSTLSQQTAGTHLGGEEDNGNEEGALSLGVVQGSPMGRSA